MTPNLCQECHSGKIKRLSYKCVTWEFFFGEEEQSEFPRLGY